MCTRGVLVFFLTVLLVVNLGGLSVCIGEIGFTVPLLCRSVFGRDLLAGRLAVSSNASCAMVSGARGREGKRQPAGSLAGGSGVPSGGVTVDGDGGRVTNRRVAMGPHMLGNIYYVHPEKLEDEEKELLYVDRVTLDIRDVTRCTPVLKGWTTKLLNARESREVSAGGFGLGRLDAPRQCSNIHDHQASPIGAGPAQLNSSIPITSDNPQQATITKGKQIPCVHRYIHQGRRKQRRSASDRIC
nr:uncharacterized protein LOC109155364 [Ipomoea batatas]